MRKLEIPERFTGRVYVGFYTDPNSPLYGMQIVTEHDHKFSDSVIIVGHTDIDIPLDQSGSLDKQVAQLKKAKQKIIDEATSKAQQIDETIESLLAIEHKGDGDD